MKFIALVISSSFLFFGCGNSENKKIEDVYTIDYDTQSCKFSATEGGGVNLSKAQSKKWNKGAFDKEFNESLFEEIRHASLLNTIEFVRRTGVELFKAPPVATTSCSASLFADLPMISGGVKRNWDQSSAAVETKNGFVLGLYLERQQFSDEILDRSAVIVVRENTNRHTLVHEFLHHLFTERANQKGQSALQARNEINRLVREIERLERQKLGAAENLKKKIELFSRYVEALDRFFLGFYLEEVAIEKLIKDQIKLKKMSFIPNIGNGYLLHSARTALAEYEKMEESASKLESLASLIGEREESEKIKKTQMLISSRILEINKIQSQYPTEKSPEGLLGFAAVNSNHNKIEAQAGCSHVKEADLVMEKIKNIQF